MAEILTFRPQIELAAEENLAGFVELCRTRLDVFGRDLDFNKDVWDITDAVKLKGRGKQRVRCVFSTLGTCDSNVPTMMAEPFLGFAKAEFRYFFGFRPTKSFQPRIGALRSLEAALSETGVTPNPVFADTGTFNRAAQLVEERYIQGVAYQIGQRLELLAKFMTSNRLTRVPVLWRNPIRKPSALNRVGSEFDKRRAEKLPSAAAMEALPEIFRLATKPSDVIASSVTAILCSAPDRINEVLLLRENCEVHDMTEEGKGAYGLRWWPAKDAAPMIKWIVPTMASVVQDAIERIRKLTASAREIAAWYEREPTRMYVPVHLRHLREKEFLTLREVAQLVFETSSRGAGQNWCLGNQIPSTGSGSRRRVRFRDVEIAVINSLPRDFPWLNREVGLKFSDALLVVRRYELTESRGTLNGVIDAVTIGQIGDALGGRAKYGQESLFSRMGYSEPDGSPLKIKTHQFRHYLNTLAQAGGMSQLDIAKWSGRRDIRQNEAYDHLTSDQMLAKIRSAIGELPETKATLENLPARVLISSDEFLRLKIPTAHTTDFGFCIHDYTMSPCQLHMDCLNCGEQVCIKGDKAKEGKLKKRLEEARKLSADAQEAMKQGYVGGDNWMRHHQRTLARMEQLVAIYADSAVPDGSIVQLTAVSSTSRIDHAIESRERVEISRGNFEGGGCP